ncbi:MAG TPA: hypothetical protein HPP94_08740 [Desulfuromonadales bacterium]|nr:hypothetical protein [Desulfuromonadales bacterium]
MNNFIWLTICLTLILMGAVIGWGMRAASIDDRYIRSLVERNETERAYYQTQYDH